MGVLALALMAAARLVSAEDSRSPATSQTVAFHIERQPLDRALKTFADQAGLQLLFHVEGVSIPKGLQSPPLSGAFTPDEALQRLLASSGLRYQFVNPRTVTIRLASDAASPEGHNATMPDTSKDNASEEGAQKKSFWDRFRLAQVDETKTAGDRPVDGSGADANATSASAVEEIVVTAQKRIERLQDVPVPVTALSADSLVNNNQLLLQDYYTAIPGLNITPGLQSTTLLSIRGVTTGAGTNPTVGVMIDDVPYGASTSLGQGNVVPDIDPGDLARIEVLRGPQGTLYGASSMGGVLKFVTRDPSTDDLTGRMQAGMSSVSNGDKTGYNVRAAVNVPLASTFAVSASAFDRHDPGYIDNVATGERGVNRAAASGGRLAALWRPSEVFSVKLSALAQQIRADGRSDVLQLPGLTDLQQSNLRGSGGYERKVQAYNATLTGHIGTAELTSVSGYNVNSYTDSFDYTYALGGLTQTLFGVRGAELLNDSDTHKFTQEIRLAVPIGRSVDWLLGAFYTDEDSALIQRIDAVNPATVARAATLNTASFPTRYREYAAFTDLTFHLTDRFQVQLGGRESRVTTTNDAETTSGPVPIILSVAVPRAQARANAFTYLVTPQFKASADLMIYARLASGYRAGGPNANGGAAGTPLQFEPDKTLNYEAGVKADFFDHELSVDFSAYYIDWKDIQLSLRNPTTALTYKANGSRARSQGVELSATAKPLRGLALSAWLAYDDAVLSEPLPLASTVYGADGDRLPLSSRFSGNVAIDQDFHLTGSVTGFIGGSCSYLSDRLSIFQGQAAGVPLPRQRFPAYARTDVRAGVRSGSWTANVYVNNVTDRRGILQGGLGYNPPYAFTYIQPRTAGLSLSKTFP